jgi:hypothetical protein
MPEPDGDMNEAAVTVYLKAHDLARPGEPSEETVVKGAPTLQCR